MIASLILSSLLTAPAAQAPQPSPIFFRAEPEDGGGTYAVYFDENPSLLRSFEGIVLALPSRGEKLDSYTVGSASLKSLHSEDGVSMAYVSLDFRDGFTPLEDEEFMVQLGLEDPNPHFDGLAFGIASHAITIHTMEGEALLSIQDTAQDGAYFDQVVLRAMRDELQRAGKELREAMDDSAVESGRFQGGTMFDSMENASLEDLRLFLERIERSPLSFMGEDWMLAEIYATWVMQGAPNAPKKSDGLGTDAQPEFGTGLRFAESTDDGFPCIESLSSTIYGSGAGVVTPGARILAMNGKSLYGAEPGDLSKSLQELPPNGVADVVLHTVMNGQFELRLFQLPMPSTPHWVEKAEAEDSPKLFAIRRGSKWGFIDSTGDEVIEPTFDGVYGHLLGHTFVGGLQAVEVGGKWGYINLAGEMVIEPKWPSANPFFGDYASVMDPNEGGLFSLGARHGFIDRSGREVIPPKYVPSIQAPGFYGGLCAVSIDEKVGFIDRRGELTIPARFSGVGRFHQGLAAARMNEDGPWGYIGPKGEWLIEPRFKTAGEFHGGRAIVQEGERHLAINPAGEVTTTYSLRPNTGFAPLRAENDRIRGWSEDIQRFGFMNAEGKTVIPPMFTKAQPTFHGGLVAVTTAPPVAREAGGWMFIDPSGKVQIEGPFDEVSWFSEGACWVCRGGRWGLIDRTGKWLAEPRLGNRPRPLDSGISSVRILRTPEGGNVPGDFYVYFDRTGEEVWSRFED